MTEYTEESKFTCDKSIFCPLRNGCCIKECPAYLPAADKKVGNPWGSCRAAFLVGNE